MDFERYIKNKKWQKKIFLFDSLRFSIGKKRADDHNKCVYKTIQGMTLTRISFESLWCHLFIPKSQFFFKIWVIVTHFAGSGHI